MCEYFILVIKFWLLVTGFILLNGFVYAASELNEYQNKFENRAYVHSLNFKEIKQESKLPQSVFDCIKSFKKLLPQEERSLEAAVIANNSEIAICGDNHGSYKELKAQIIRLRELGHFGDKNPLLLRENKFLVGTGDVIAASKNGLRSFMLIMILKIINPKNVYLCRGNHENSNIFECLRWGEQFELQRELIKKEFALLFELLPLALFLGIKNPSVPISFGMFNHGGLIDDDLPANARAFAAIKVLLENACSAAELRTRGSGFGDRMNGLVWGDYSVHPIGKPSPKARCRPEIIHNYNHEDARHILQRLSDEKGRYEIYLVGRGHQHGPYAISELNEPMAPDLFETAFPASKPLEPEKDAMKIFKPIEGQDGVAIRVSPHAIFTFMCNNDEAMRITEVGFGIFSNKEGQWFLTPYRMHLEDVGKYLAADAH